MTLRTPVHFCALVLAMMFVGCAAQSSPSSSPPAPPVSASPPIATASPVQAAVFEADFLMAHQSVLTPAQVSSFQQDMSATQQEILQHEWRLRAKTEELTRALTAAPINEAEALQLAADVGGIESQIKSTHLRLLIRLKNQLTTEQQTQLRALLRSP